MKHDPERRMSYIVIDVNDVGLNDYDRIYGWMTVSPRLND